MKKNSCTPINPTKYSCYWLKEIHTRNLIMKKNSCGSKIPHPRPPKTFLMVRPNGLLSLDIPLLTWDEPWREHGFEYDSFENQKEPQATKNKTNHLQVSLVSKVTHNSTCKREKVNGKLWSSLRHTGPGPPTVYSDLITHHDWPVKNTIGDCQSVWRKIQKYTLPVICWGTH